IMVEQKFVLGAASLHFNFEIGKSAVESHRSLCAGFGVCLSQAVSNMVSTIPRGRRHFGGLRARPEARNRRTEPS
ncbi:hypothetical protein NECAME_18956, partial [Necator americanus]